MGKIKKGILGGFNGKVGNVVGASWKGIAYMRSEAQSIKNPRTTKQQNQRGAFAYVSDLCSRALPAVRVGYGKYQTKRSAFNACVSDNVNYIVEEGIETTPSQVLDFVSFSKGSYALLTSLSASYSVVHSETGSSSTVTLTYTGTSSSNNDGLHYCVIVDRNDGTLEYVLCDSSPVSQSSIRIDLPFDLSEEGISCRIAAFYCCYDLGSPNYLDCGPTFVTIAQEAE